jgi:hypothetical protein
VESGAGGPSGERRGETSDHATRRGTGGTVSMGPNGPRIQNFRKKRGKQLKYKMDKLKKKLAVFFEII